MLFGRTSSQIKFIFLDDYEVIHSKTLWRTKDKADITAAICILSVRETSFVLVYVDQMQMSKTDFR